MLVCTHLWIPAGCLNSTWASPFGPSAKVSVEDCGKILYFRDLELRDYSFWWDIIQFWPLWYVKNYYTQYDSSLQFVWFSAEKKNLTSVSSGQSVKNWFFHCEFAILNLNCNSQSAVQLHCFHGPSELANSWVTARHAGSQGEDFDPNFRRGNWRIRLFRLPVY